MGSVSGGPYKLRVLDKPEFDQFCSLMIKAVETANAHYGCLVRLWLSPQDWRGITLNTCKQVSAFVSAVRDLAQMTRANPESIEVWEQVWGPGDGEDEAADKPRRKVPGFRSAHEFWDSELGRELRRSGVLGKPLAPEEPDDDDEGSIDRTGLPGMLRKCLEAGIIDDYDAWLIAQVNQGRRLLQLSRSLKTFIKFGKFQIPEGYIAELLERIRRYRTE